MEEESYKYKRAQTITGSEVVSKETLKDKAEEIKKKIEEKQRMIEINKKSLANKFGMEGF